MARSFRADPDDEMELRQDEDMQPEAWLTIEQVERLRAWSAERRSADPWLGSWGIRERMAFYNNLLEAGRPAWDYGRIYLNANLMRTDAVAPSYTWTQQRRDEDAERVDYGHRMSRFRVSE